MSSEENKVVQMMPADEFPTVWDEYVGQNVCVQLKTPYFGVTTPGVFVKNEGGEIGMFPAILGLFGLKKDAQGNVRITMLMRDPDRSKTTMVRTDFAPSQVEYITVAQEESLIKES